MEDFIMIPQTPFETFENLHFPVTPAKAGVQNTLKTLDSGFCRNDDGESETVFFKGLLF